MEIKAFITHKLDERYADCADSFAVNSDCKRIAVSDGVSQSFSPQDWSKLLVSAFADKAYTPKESDAMLVNLQKMWHKIVLHNLKKLEEAGEVTWMMENCIEDKESAGATFCGVELQGDTFHLWVLGDSALVTVSPEFEYKLYSTQDGEFDNRPDFLDSYGAHVGDFREYDIPKANLAYILLVTDPFSDLLHQCENNSTAKKILEKLINVQTHDEFCVVVDELRTDHSMHNDDSTFVSIKIDDCNEFNILNSTDIDSLMKQESEVNSEEPSASAMEDDDKTEHETKPFDVSAILRKGFTGKRLIPLDTEPEPEETLPEAEETHSEELDAPQGQETAPEEQKIISDEQEIFPEQEATSEEQETTPEKLDSIAEKTAEEQAATSEKSYEEEQPEPVTEMQAAPPHTLSYEEFLASAEDVRIELVKAQPCYLRFFQRISSSEFEILWHTIADKLYKK